jgi:hypothetical protein
MAQLDESHTTRDTHITITLDSVLNKQRIEKYLPVMLCKICNNIALKPLKDVLGCGGYFCQVCLEQFWKKDEQTQELIKSCPNNCTEFCFKDISGLELQQFKEILVKCKNYDHGCKMIYNYDFLDLLNEHEKECEFKHFLNISKDNNKTLSNINVNSLNTSPISSFYCEIFNKYCQNCKQNYSENKEKHDCIAYLLKFIEQLQENINKDVKTLLKENASLKIEIDLLKNKLIFLEKDNDKGHVKGDSIFLDKNDTKETPQEDFILLQNNYSVSKRNYNTLSNNSIKQPINEFDCSENKMLAFSNTKSITNIRELNTEISKPNLKKSSSNFKDIEKVHSTNNIKKLSVKDKNLPFYRPSNYSGNQRNINLLNNNVFTLDNNNFQLDKSKILKEIDSALLGDQFNKKKCELIFRGSEHGFKAEKFHQICDGKFPTLVLIKSNFGKIFGGFTKCKWNSNECWVSDDSRTSFIFSIHNSSRHMIKLPKYAIYCGKAHGPIFGKGYDIYISNNCNVNNNSFCNLGNSYSLNNTAKCESIESKSYLAGNVNFKVIELEVFQIFD